MSGQWLTRDEWQEKQAANFVRPFLRDGYRLTLAGNVVRLEPGRNGQEITPEWEKRIAHHAPALRRIILRQMEAQNGCDNSRISQSIDREVTA